MGVCEQDAKALPVAVQTEQTFRGHLPMCPVATVAHRMMADVLVAKTPKSGLTVSSMPSILHEQHVIAYDGQKPSRMRPVERWAMPWYHDLTGDKNTTPSGSRGAVMRRQ